MRTYKNFWSLNTDEAVVASILRDKKSKDVEVFMPLNSQMEGIDLVLLNTKNRGIKTIQVKGAKGASPKKKQDKDYGHGGSTGWFRFPQDVFYKSTADYFIFLIYAFEEDFEIGKKHIEPRTITIPTDKLKKLVEENNKIGKGGIYNLHIWVNHKTKEVYQFRDKEYCLDEYLERRGLEILNRDLSSKKS